MPEPDFKSQLKSLFNTPQKVRITVLCLLVAAATLGAVIAVCLLQNAPAAGTPPAPGETATDDPVQSDPPATDDPAQSQGLTGLVPALTINEAREQVLLDAGVGEEEADISREALEQDNGVWVYSFQFRTERADYQYKINANTGEVRTMIKEVFPPSAPEETEPPMPSVPPLPESSAAPGESAPSKESVPSESTPPAEAGPQPSEPPQPAQSAAPEPVQTPAPATPSPDPSQTAFLYIGMTQAKSIALSHAGLSASQVTVTRERMTREDGRVVYEIEFRRNGVEYEYEIDAQSGTILDFELDDD